MPNTILIIDDDRKLNELLTEYLGQFQMTVFTAEHPREGLSLLHQQSPNLVILDLMLPDQDGFAVCREIRKESSVPIIMLTARGDLPDRVAGLELGADDYLAKPFEPRELVARIKTVLRRGTSTSARYIEHEQLEADELAINLRTRTVSLDNKPLDLTTMEFEILSLFLNNPGVVLTREEMMDRIRGIDWEAYNRSVDVGVSRLRQKLHDNPKRPRYIKTIWGAGYQFLPTPRPIVPT
ncbi:MAG: response regulator transcription factor [Nitrospirales bacterium]|nr:response regulator transcription factor [Nitrospira sp.]MDR4501275.1 response regulator transcription factor [Nitrospirales bacterium]